MNSLIEIIPSLFESRLCDLDLPRNTVPKKQAEQLFLYFKHHPLFKWNDANNGCEGRADAICVLLDEWNIPNYKGWVFSGFYLKKHVGALQQNWNYHVAAVLAVEEDGMVKDYVIDPATNNNLLTIDEWAISVTELPHSYYFTRQSHWYIFPAKKISTSTWNSRNNQNRKWMIQCLAGINSLTPTGKAELTFNKLRLRNTEEAFKKLKREKPRFG